MVWDAGVRGVSVVGWCGGWGGGSACAVVFLFVLMMACFFVRVVKGGFWKVRMEGSGEEVVVCGGCVCLAHRACLRFSSPFIHAMPFFLFDVKLLLTVEPI